MEKMGKCSKMIDTLQRKHYTCPCFVIMTMKNLFRNIQRRILDDPSSQGRAYSEPVI